MTRGVAPLAGTAVIACALAAARHDPGARDHRPIGDRSTHDLAPELWTRWYEPPCSPSEDRPVRSRERPIWVGASFRCFARRSWPIRGLDRCAGACNYVRNSTPTSRSTLCRTQRMLPMHTLSKFLLAVVSLRIGPLRPLNSPASLRGLIAHTAPRPRNLGIGPPMPPSRGLVHED